MSAPALTTEELRDFRAQLDRIEKTLLLKDDCPILTNAEAASYCKFRTYDSFQRWAKRRRVERLAEDRWSRNLLNRALRREACL